MLGAVPAKPRWSTPTSPGAQRTSTQFRPAADGQAILELQASDPHDIQRFFRFIPGLNHIPEQRFP
jgi:hypothetical protein